MPRPTHRPEYGGLAGSHGAEAVQSARRPAATVPLTIDYWREQGRVKRGDRIFSFGSSFTWGAAIFTL
jgi:hypothetical protein